MNMIDKIKLLFKAREPIGELVGEFKTAKDNWKKIRFWLALITSLTALLSAMKGIMPVTAAMITSVALTMIYNIFQAFKDADEVGFSPLLKSTKVWMGILNAIAIGFVGLKTGGIDAHWVEASIGAIGTITMVAREIGALQPEGK